MEITNVNSISGRRLTFYELVQEYHIQIPIIQRDYAQGRKSVYELRNLFLDALVVYLEENRKHRDLDFVYGNQLNEVVDDVTKFIPLDGQQRLTTLFLLHWYLASKDGDIIELRNQLVYDQGSNNPQSKFTYETRTSSREFCDALLLSDIDFNHLFIADINKNNSLSKTIKDSSWYFLSWETDPTIQSMLVMLDDIHSKFKDKSGFFSRLISPDNPVITFQFLDLKEFNLTDDLYIKMNARGVPLTPFENFKAKFEQYIKNSSFNNKYDHTLSFNGLSKPVDLKTYFSNKIDTDWANLFWAHTLEEKKKFDKLIMNFIRAMVTNHCSSFVSTEFLKYLLNKENENVSFQQYVKHNCLDEKLISDLITVLDLMENGNTKVKEYLPGFFSFKERETFETVINNSFNQAGYVERIKFHSYCQYLIKWSNAGEFEDIEGLKNWMRVVQNLTDNTAPYNNERAFINSIDAINELIPYSNLILHHILVIDKLIGFDEIQFKEEKLKSLLLSKSKEWEELIFAAEQHGYFNGQIGFVLFLSGIEDYYNKHKNCSWADDEDKQFQKSFTIFTNKAKKVINGDGLILNQDFIWDRALLTKGYYLIEEGSNQSFLINRDRDISWKRLLKRDKKESHNAIVKAIFTDIDENNVIESLTNLIEKYEGNGWASEFISNPKLFNYLGRKRYVRKDSAHGFVLFSGERMSGAHAELFTYSMFLKFIKNNSYSPFDRAPEYHFAIGDDFYDLPCIRFEGCCINKINYSLKVYFVEPTEGFPYPYQIKFEKSKGDKGLQKYPDDIRDILNRCKFSWYGDEKEWMGFWLTKKTDTECNKAILKLCDLLDESFFR